MKTADMVSDRALELGSGSPRTALDGGAKERFLINVGTNVTYVALNAIIMIWYTPFLLRHLGPAAYGMIPLTQSVIMYVSIVSASLNVSVVRQLAIDLNGGSIQQANQTFNTALAISLIACGVLLVPSGIAAYCFPLLFDLPSGMGLEVQFLFLSVVATVLFGIIGANFSVSSTVHSRFDLQNLVRAVVLLSRTAVVIVCFTFWPASLWHVSAALILAAAINLVGDILIWRRMTPQLNLDRRAIDAGRYRKLVSFSGWSSVNQIGTLLLIQVDIIVVNIMFGAEATGQYGSVMLFATLITTMTMTISGVLSPAIIMRSAQDDIEGVRRIAVRAVKFLCIGLAVPVGLLCGFGRPILSLWLGPEFAELDVLLILLVGHLSINLAARPLVYIITAYDKVRVEALFTVGLGLLSVVLSVAVSKWGLWGVLGVALTVGALRSLKNVLFVSTYSAAIMRLPWWTFYTPLLAGSLGTFGIALAGRLVSDAYGPKDWYVLAWWAVGLTTAYTAIALVLGINRSDRAFLLSFLDRRSHA
jgi:membrane protein EpsK